MRRASVLVALAVLGFGCAKLPDVSPSVTASPIVLRDVAAQAGLDYRFTLTGKRPATILQTIGNGAAFFDFNADGNLDILLVSEKPALFVGDGKGHFAHSTALPPLTGHFLGCAVGDIDNDSFPDLYLSGFREGRLLHNAHGQHFVDITQQAGLKPQPWGTSVAFGDVDGDGFLDLYVGNYVVFGPDAQQLCKVGGVLTGCPPHGYGAERGVLYRNRGGKGFVDATGPLGFGTAHGKMLGGVFAPLDSTGNPYLMLANDELPGDLFQPTSKGYTNCGDLAGIALTSTGGTYGGMGVDAGDYDNDGKLDLATMTFALEPKLIFHNETVGTAPSFQERSQPLGIADLTHRFVAFGVKWADFDNDGWLDLVITNGHTSDNIAAVDRAHTFRQPSQLLLNQSGQHFIAVSLPDIDKPLMGRGLATGDYDNDGKVDALAIDSDGTPLLLHNETPHASNSLTLRLLWHNRDAYGALVTVTAGGKTYVRHCHADGSYLSSSDPRVHVGLGAANEAKVTIRWPDGKTQSFGPLAANRVHTLKAR